MVSADIVPYNFEGLWPSLEKYFGSTDLGQR